MRRSLRIEKLKEHASSIEELEAENQDYRRKRQHRKRKNSLNSKGISGKQNVGKKKAAMTSATQTKDHRDTSEKRYVSPIIITEPTSFGKSSSWKESKRSTRDTSYVASTTSQHWIQCSTCLQWFRTNLSEETDVQKDQDEKLFIYSQRPFQCGCRVSLDEEERPTTYLENRLMSEAPKLLLHVKKAFVDAVISTKVSVMPTCTVEPL